MRYRISTNIRWTRFVFLAMGCLPLINLINQSRQSFPNSGAFLIQLLLLVFCGFLFYLFHSAKTVEFDQTNMYVINGRNEMSIPLKNVYKIKLTMTRINNRHLWKIGYYNNEGERKAVRILPRWFYKYFNQFEEAVKKANPDVKISNWSWSFDLDQ